MSVDGKIEVKKLARMATHLYDASLNNLHAHFIVSSHLNASIDPYVAL